jgi:hypothetical protein
MALHQIASEEDAMPDERAREASSSLIEASSIRPAEHGPSCVPADSQHYSVLTGNNIIHAHGHENGTKYTHSFGSRWVRVERV